MPSLVSPSGMPWSFADPSELRSAVAAGLVDPNAQARVGGVWTGVRDILVGMVGEIVGNVVTGHRTGPPPTQVVSPGLPEPPLTQDVSVAFPNTGMPTEVFGRPRYRYTKDGRITTRKRPSMNVLNPRALKRAMKRVEGFAGFAKRTISFTKKVRMKKRKR